MRNWDWLCTLLLVGLGAPQAFGEDVWEALGQARVVEVLTEDPNGKTRATKVWIVDVEDALYLRTSRSKWLENLRRDPNFTLRHDQREHAVRATEIEGDAIIDAVDAASRIKYGWQESLIHVFRFRTPEILRIDPR